MAKQQGRSGGTPAEPQAFGADYAAEAALPANAPLGLEPAAASNPQMMRRGQGQGPNQGQGPAQAMRGPGGRPMQGAMQGGPNQGQGQMRGRGPQQGQQQQGVDPKVVAPLVAEGKQAFEKGDSTLAELRAMQALQQVPDHLEALVILYQCKKKANQGGPQMENILRRIVRKNANLLWATTELAFMLFARGERVECEQHARTALRLAPRNPQAHGIMGMILTETNRALAGEYHFRKAIEISGENTRIAANLANNLKTQGKVDESETWYRKATELDPKNVNAWIGWCRMEEARRAIPQAWELLHEAEKVAPDTVDLSLTRAILYGREKKNEEAVAELSRSQAEGKSKGMQPIALLERGRLYDKMDRFEEAWADYVEGKRLCREVQGRKYNDRVAKNLVERLKRFFIRQRMTLLPRAHKNEHMPQPIFIVGYPRSGTTMVEQTVTASPLASAGDELVFISDLARVGPRWLGSPLQYPECLSDLWMGDNQLVLDQFRDYYLERAGQLGIWEKGAKYFTDKMPLNETHLGLIHLVFPESPIIYVRRHPLDILTSNFSNFLTHGFNQAFDLKTSATHYALIDDLVEHYKQQLDLNFLEVRYEDLVENQEPNVRKMFEFIGLDFDPKSLSFHENQRYARTASYAQVTEKLYDSSVYRYRHYRKYMDEAVDILRPCLERLKYPTE
ncbi:MAG: sulfotransferase [Proteobacteria bacterium]|nr:sulfotransferase [Pseudomonadota bacterium]